MRNFTRRAQEKAKRFGGAKEVKKSSAAQSTAHTPLDGKQQVGHLCHCGVLSNGVDDTAISRTPAVGSPEERLKDEKSPIKKVPETQPLPSGSEANRCTPTNLLPGSDDVGPPHVIHDPSDACGEEPSNLDTTCIEAKGVSNTSPLAGSDNLDLDESEDPSDAPKEQQWFTYIFTAGSKEPSKLERTTSELNMKTLWQSPSYEHSSLVNRIVCKTNKPGTFYHYGAETHRLKDLIPYLYPFTNAELVVEWADLEKEKVVANIRHERLGYLVKYDGEPKQYRGPALQHLIRQLELEWEKKGIVVKKLTCTYIGILRLFRGIWRWIGSLLLLFWIPLSYFMKGLDRKKTKIE